MANQRQKGTKLAGAYIPDSENDKLAWLAEQLGYTNKADYLRALFEKEIEAQKKVLARKKAKG